MSENLLEFEAIDARIVGCKVSILYPRGSSSLSGQTSLAGIVESVGEFGTAKLIRLQGSSEQILIRPKMKKLFSKEMYEPSGNPIVSLE